MSVPLRDQRTSRDGLASASAQRVAEPRWPMAVTVLAAIAVTVLLPRTVRAGPPWLLPSLEGLLLIAMIFGDPGRIDRRSPLLQGLDIGLVVLLVFDALWSTVWLIHELVRGGAITKSGNTLLAAGLLVWLLNIIAFGLLYWVFDDGGPADRFYHGHRHPDLAFTQDLSPDLVGAKGWRPLFFDYLYLGFTASTALSPTDVMPLTQWAKLAMAAQSLSSLIVVALIISRAVNVL
jgi:hypothetical protein